MTHIETNTCSHNTLYQQKDIELIDKSLVQIEQNYLKIEVQLTISSKLAPHKYDM